MPVLPDYLRSNLNIVFCGTAVGTKSAKSGHYYSGPGNEFWHLLHEAGITPVRLMPEEDHRICEFGCGLTDLAKGIAASSDAGLRSHYDVSGFISQIVSFAPQWVAFHGKEAAKEVTRHRGHRGLVRLGIQAWRIGESDVFILPSSSAANRDASRLEGKT